MELTGEFFPRLVYAVIEGESKMANREQRGNRETRKPKKEKVAKGAPPAATTPAPKPGQPVAWKQSPKKP